jgi:hypothetical protein
MRNFFFSICEEYSDIKNAKLSIQALKEYLQSKYSKIVGERLLVYLESEGNQLYRTDFTGFLQVVMNIINEGLHGYKKMMFAAFSLQNPGRICEHDVFTILE